MSLKATSNPPQIEWSVPKSINSRFFNSIAFRGVVSHPPEGMYRITNMFVNPKSGKIVIEYDNEP